MYLLSSSVFTWKFFSVSWFSRWIPVPHWLSLVRVATILLLEMSSHIVLKIQKKTFWKCKHIIAKRRMFFVSTVIISIGNWFFNCSTCRSGAHVWVFRNDDFWTQVSGNPWNRNATVFASFPNRMSSQTFGSSSALWNVGVHVEEIYNTAIRKTNNSPTHDSTVRYHSIVDSGSRTKRSWTCQEVLQYQRRASSVPESGRWNKKVDWTSCAPFYKFPYSGHLAD